MDKLEKYIKQLDSEFCDILLNEHNLTKQLESIKVKKEIYIKLKNELNEILKEMEKSNAIG